MRNCSILAVAAVLVVAAAGTNAATINGAAHTEELRWSAMVRKDIDQAIIDALEKLRADMKTGVPSLGIPPLEPFHVSHLDFTINEEIATVKGFLDNLTITHLSDFKTIAIKNDLKNLKAFFKFSFPTIPFVGHYNISGKVLSSLNVFGDGDFWLTLTDLTTWGNVSISTKDGTEDSAIVINSIDVDFTLGDMKANFQNLMGGGSEGDAVNAIVNENGVQLVTQEKKPVTALIQKIVLGYANKLVGRYTLRQVLKYLGVEN